MGNQYRISEQFIRNKKSLILSVRIILPVFLVLVFILPMLTLYDLHPEGGIIYIVSLAAAMLFIQLLFIIIPKMVFKMYDDMGLAIHENVIEKRNKNNTEKIVLNESAKLEISRNKSNDILQLVVSAGNEKMFIFGFEKMDDIYTNILSYVQISNITEKNIKIDESTKRGRLNSIFLGLFLYIGLMVFGVFLSLIFAKYLNISIIEKTDNIVPLFAGLFFLIFTPISKRINKKYKRMEIIGGILLILLSVVNFLL
ncbi:hypothetical protein [Breznakiella homolactica]|uniref:Uncharacterized protein n=1 Tax=Breznakiella homolactica TaxID=2798577 RepID=A0A7T8BCU4_9SPIR|nr:hypothetical protein [Breznakiella homolactica]QQO10608.1 hypothetical protein JFL75_06745 [Breznakiella homolactica]